MGIQKIDFLIALKYTTIQVGKTLPSRRNKERKQDHLAKPSKESHEYESDIEDG
ncbi:MAG: hypothetical protein ACUVRP_04600 [Chlorobiales bacterium]